MAPTKRPTPRKPAGTRRKPTAGASPATLILYPLSIAGGLWLGVQAYAQFLDPQRPPAEKPPATRQAVRPAKPAPTLEPRPEAPEPAPRVSIRPPESIEKMPAVEIERGTSGRAEVALTLDAGADWRPTRQILETLAKEGVRCTFFLTGEWVQENPKTARAIAEAGHEIGNHSWDHSAFTSLSAEQIGEQLSKTEELIRDTTGKSSRPYFRPPLGARDARVRQAIADQGFLNVYWTLDSHDSVRKGITAAQIKERVLGEIAPGSIVLLHCGSQATAEALPEILSGLRERGLRPVMLSELLAK